MSVKTRSISLCGMLFALAVTLSYFEGLIPSVGVPGIKLGLSNIVTMYSLVILGVPYAFGVAVSKAVFVLLTKGLTSSMMSMSGGVLSVFVMWGLKKIDSLIIISIFGAMAHNIGQIITASLIIRSTSVFWYLPILILSGCAMGCITAFTLRLIMPYLNSNWRICAVNNR